jgi:hypothetical protein
MSARKELGAFEPVGDGNDSEPALYVAFRITAGARRNLIVAHATHFSAGRFTPGFLYVRAFAQRALISSFAAEEHVNGTARPSPHKTRGLKSSFPQPDTSNACNDHGERCGG